MSLTQLSKEKCPTKQHYRSNQKWLRNSLATRKKILQLYLEKRPSSCPSYRLFVTFLPEKKTSFTGKKLLLTKCFWHLCDVSPPDQDFSEPPPRKQPLSSWVTVTKRPVCWWWLCNLEWKMKNFVTFQDVWCVRISITTHYNSTHVIITYLRVEIHRGGHWENTLKTHTRHHHDVYHLFRSRSTSFLCELHSGLSVLQWCFALFERPTAENGSALEVVSQFCLLTLWDRFVDLSVAISVSIRVSLQPYSLISHPFSFQLG